MPIEGAIEGVVEEVATNLEEVAQATRRINAAGAGYFVGGLLIGAAVGFYFGYRWNKEKLRSEAFAESEKEVEKIRETYREGRVVEVEKPHLDEVLAERGYTLEETAEGEPGTHILVSPVADERPLKLTVAVEEPKPREVPPISSGRTADIPPDPIGRSAVGIWNYDEEEAARAARTENSPYVVHQDEFMNEDNGYPHVTYTYYAIDDVLVGEENRPIPHADIIVGQNNLRFGHGTDDEDVVFVRNDHLQLEMEICRLNESFEVEVLGLDPDEPS